MSNFHLPRVSPRTTRLGHNLSQENPLPPTYAHTSPSHSPCPVREPKILLSDPIKAKNKKRKCRSVLLKRASPALAQPSCTQEINSISEIYGVSTNNNYSSNTKKDIRSKSRPKYAMPRFTMKRIGNINILNKSKEKQGRSTHDYSSLPISRSKFNMSNVLNLDLHDELGALTMNNTDINSPMNNHKLDNSTSLQMQKLNIII